MPQERHRIEVEEFQATYRVSREHPSPERVRERLNEAVQEVAALLSRAVDACFSNDDESLWFIPELEVAVCVNAAWDRQRLGTAWTEQIARALVSQLHAGPGNGVLRFPNRAAYLARFLRDLADGSAWSRWQYRQFDGLSMLPLSAALRTALCREPETGLAALCLLPPPDREPILRALTPLEARRVTDSLAESLTDVSWMSAVERIKAAWNAAPPEPLSSDEELRHVLRLFLAAAQEGHGQGGMPLARAAAALLRLARRLRQADPEAAGALLAAVQEADRPALYRAVETDDAEAISPLLDCPPEQAREMAEWLQGEAAPSVQTPAATPPPAAREAAPPPRRQTAFGAAFLLLPLLDALPLDTLTEGWPDAGEIPADGLTRMLLLALCRGAERADAAFHDPLLRSLLLIPPTLDAADVARWASGLQPASLRRFHERLRDWQREEGMLDEETLLLLRASPVGRPLALLLDVRRGVWQCIEGYTAKGLPALRQRLSRWIADTGEGEVLLLCEEELADGWSAPLPGLRVLSLEGEAAREIIEADRDAAEVLRGRERLPADYAYLTPPRAWRLSPSLDRLLRRTAQSILRDFAWRLPGFSRSSLPYLFANFMDIRASLEEEEARRVVRLSRPPLHVILQMTGMLRATYRLSWQEDRPLTLFTPEN